MPTRPTFRPVTTGMPPTRPLDARDVKRIMRRVDRWSQRNRKPGQHRPGALTEGFRAVLRATISFANPVTGACFPSYEAIAERARKCAATAKAAIALLERAGALVIWRRVQVAGGRVVRASNAYVFRGVRPKSKNQPGGLKPSSKVLVHGPRPAARQGPAPRAACREPEKAAAAPCSEAYEAFVAAVLRRNGLGPEPQAG